MAHDPAGQGQPMRIAFFGSPAAAVPAFEAISKSDHQLVAAVTAPDRPRGRGLNVEPSAVKQRAAELGIPVIQPATLRSPDVVDELAGLRADVFVVTAYGLILPKSVLDLPPRGCFNIHFSLLPRLRGAAPVQWALLEGHTITGVTIMLMDEGMDTGPIVAQHEEQMFPTDTGGVLEERLAAHGAGLLMEVLGRVASGDVAANPQPDDVATYAPKITPADARIDWAADADSIANRVRAFDPRPGAWTVLGGRRLKIWRVSVSPEPSVEPPGTIDVTASEMIYVDTGTQRIGLEEVQPEGKARMSAGAFMRGYRPMTGDRFE